MQVQDLFKDAPDLLSEFKDFLPEIAGPAAPTGVVGMVPQPPGGPGIAGPPWNSSDNANKRGKHHHKADSPFSPYQDPHSPQNSRSPSHTHGHAARQSSLSHSHSNQITGLLSHGMGCTMMTPDELLFFDRAKKTLDSQETYDEFLKLLNLFLKDIIDVKVLIQQAQTFLGNGELLSQFKELVGWDERLHSVEYGPPGSIRTGPPKGLTADRTEEGQGIDI